MEPYNQSIISYLEEQLPDIQASHDDVTMAGDHEYASYLEGITEAYEHIISKFGS